MADQPHDDESQDNVGTGAEISTENDVPAIFYDGSDGVPHSGAPQREIYLSELAQSQEDIARLTRTIISGCDEYGSREHRDHTEIMARNKPTTTAIAICRYWSLHRRKRLKRISSSCVLVLS